MITTKSQVVLVDPTVKSVAATAAMAPRPQTMDDLTVGLLHNGKWNGDLLLDATYRLLSERYKLKGAVRHNKGVAGGASRPFSADVIDDVAKRCQVAVTAVGD